MKPRVHTCLWFDRQTEEAAQFYTSVFPNSRITETTHYGAASHIPEGTALTVSFELDGQTITAINGGPQYTHSPAMSLVVTCTTQDEINYYLDALSTVPKAEQCGWLVDRYGVSWQIVPQQVMDMLQQPNAAAKQRMLAALMQMKKLNIAALQSAFSAP
jgi:predicted 3-demethylubiquinone-9 3-methyltransferase (glyoxalase superfamily)